MPFPGISGMGLERFLVLGNHFPRPGPLVVAMAVVINHLPSYPLQTTSCIWDSSTNALTGNDSGVSRCLQRPRCCPRVMIPIMIYIYYSSITPSLSYETRHFLLPIIPHWPPFPSSTSCLANYRSLHSDKTSHTRRPSPDVSESDPGPSL